MPESSEDAHGQKMSLSPLEILKAARQAVPAVDFALGVAGVAAAASIIGFFVGFNQSSVIVLSTTFISMILLFVFSGLVSSKSPSIVPAGIILLYSTIIFFCAFLVFTITAFALEWPPPWARFLGITKPIPQSASKNESPKVQTVRVLFEGTRLQHGFFTGNGYIITMASPDMEQKAKNVRITWNNNEKSYSGIAQFLRTAKSAPQVALFKYFEKNWPRYVLSMRASRSLERGERVAKYLGPNERKVGAVIRMYSKAEVEAWGISNIVQDSHDTLVTSVISEPGDGGAPVVDEQGNVVAMIYGGSWDTTLCLPIEDIKLSFPEAF